MRSFARAGAIARCFFRAPVMQGFGFPKVSPSLLDWLNNEPLVLQ
jgi:hypothetical protein